MLHKSFTAETKVLDADRGLVDCVFSVTGVKDRQGDVIEPGAFSKALAAKSSVPVVYAHKWDDINAVLGKTVGWTELRPGDGRLGPKLQAKGYGGVKATVQFDQETPSGRLALTHVAHGNVKDWSFAFDSNKALEKFDSDGTRRIREIPEIYEVTLALIGANQEAMTLALKSMAATAARTDNWLPAILAKAAANASHQFDARVGANPLLAEAAASVLWAAEDKRDKVLLEYADTYVATTGLAIAVHEAGHAVVATHYNLRPTAIKMYRGGGGGCDTPSGQISPLNDSTIDLAGLVAEQRLIGVGVHGKQLNSVDAKRPATLSAAERAAAHQSAVEIVTENEAFVATLAIALYRRCLEGPGDAIVSGSEIEEIAQMVDYLKALPRAEVGKIAAELRHKRLYESPAASHHAS